MSDLDTETLAAGPILALSSDSIRHEDRLDQWHAAVCPFNDVEVPVGQRRQFHAATSYWVIGRLVLVTSTSSRLRLVRGAAKAARDQPDHDVVVVFAAGESVTEERGQTCRLCAGDVAFGSLRDGYDFRVTSDTATWHELILPPDLSDRLTDLGDGHTGAGTVRTPQSRLLGQFICSVAVQVPFLTPEEMPLIEQAILCMYSAALGAASSDPARLSATDRQTVDRAEAVAVIERDLFSARLTAVRICDVTGMSRSALYRLFEADNGVASFIRTRRLDAFRKDLLDPRNRHQTVAALSEARGFHSPSTLNRAFRQRFGCTPTDARALSSPARGSADAARIEAVIGYLRAATGRVTAS